MNIEGSLTGRYMKDELNGIQITVYPGLMTVEVQDISNGHLYPDKKEEMMMEVYDSNQGTMVSGFKIHDRDGRPTGEEYKLSDFMLDGNITQNSFW